MVRASAKMCNVFFLIDFDICHRMISLLRDIDLHFHIRYFLVMHLPRPARSTPWSCSCLSKSECFSTWKRFVSVGSYLKTIIFLQPGIIASANRHVRTWLSSFNLTSTGTDFVFLRPNPHQPTSPTELTATQHPQYGTDYRITYEQSRWR